MMYYKVMSYIQYQDDGIPVQILPQTNLLLGHLGEPIENNFNVFTLLILDSTHSSNVHRYFLRICKKICFSLFPPSPLFLPLFFSPPSLPLSPLLPPQPTFSPSPPLTPSFSSSFLSLSLFEYGINNSRIIITLGIIIKRITIILIIITKMVT